MVVAPHAVLGLELSFRVNGLVRGAWLVSTYDGVWLCCSCTLGVVEFEGVPQGQPAGAAGLAWRRRWVVGLTAEYRAVGAGGPPDPRRL